MTSSGLVLSLQECVTACESARTRGERIVLTNGCFDILHRGHVEYLEASSKLGDRLVVAINSDRSVRTLKGPQRPIQNEEDRSQIIAALRWVDWVFLFEGPRLASEISVIRPDFYTKAGDYTLDTIDRSERNALEAAGTAIHFLPFLEGRSTSQIVQRSQNDSQEPT